MNLWEWRILVKRFLNLSKNLFLGIIHNFSKIYHTFLHVIPDVWHLQSNATLILCAADNLWLIYLFFFQVVLVFILSIASLVIYFIDASRYVLKRKGRVFLRLRNYPINRSFHLFQRGGGTLPDMERQYNTTNRFSIQYIFYGLLFYKSKFPISFSDSYLKKDLVYYDSLMFGS